MAILKVSRMGHPVLRQPAQEIPPAQLATPDLQRLIDDMIETMVDEQGIGLAAPQIHQPLRLVVLGDPDAEGDKPDAIPLTTIVNPRWREQTGQQVEAWEGCLSLPGLRGVVPRWTEVSLSALDRQGRQFELRVRDLFARVLQHEIDHLDGILYPDRMPDLRRFSFLEEFRRYWQSEAGSPAESAG